MPLLAYEVERCIPDANGKSVIGMALSHNDLLLATCGADNSVALWDPVSCSLRVRLKDHKGWVVKCCFSPNDRMLACCAIDTIYIYNVTGGGYLIREFRAHSLQINCVAWSLDNTWLGTCSSDGTIKLFKTNHILDSNTSSATFWSQRHGTPCITDNGQVAKPPPSSGHTDAVISMDFSHGATHFVSTSNDKRVLLWNTSNNKYVREFIGHNDEVLSVKWNSDDSRLVTAGKDIVFLWDVASPMPRKTMRGHRNVIYAAVFTADACSSGGRIVSGGHDRQIIIWSAVEGSLLYSLNCATTGWTMAICLSSDAFTMYTATTDLAKSIIKWKPKEIDDLTVAMSQSTLLHMGGAAVADEEDMRTRSELKKFYRRTKKYIVKKFPIVTQIKNPLKALFRPKEPSQSISVTTYQQNSGSGSRKMKVSKTVKVRSKDYTPDAEVPKTSKPEPPIQETPELPTSPAPVSAPAASTPVSAPEPTTPVSRKVQASSSKSTSSDSSFIGGLLSRKGTGRNLHTAASVKAAPVLEPQAEIPFNYSGDPDELIENPSRLDGPDEVSAARRKARREKSANFWVDRTTTDTDELKIQDVPSSDLYNDDSRPTMSLPALREVSERDSITEKKTMKDQY